LNRVGDAEALRRGLNLFGSAAKSLDEFPTEPGDFKGVFGGGDVQSQLFEFFRQGGEKDFVQVDSAIDEIHHLRRLEPLLYRVKRGVENYIMDMQVRVRKTVHGPGGQVDVFRGGEIAGLAVKILSIGSYPCGYQGLSRHHGLESSRPCGLNNPLVPGAGIGEGHGFRDAKDMILGNAPSRSGDRRQGFPSFRVFVLAEASKRLGIDSA